MSDTRYPYTYAADYIRSIPELGRDGVKLSRSEAAQIRQAIAAAIGMPDVDLACKLADLENNKTEADHNKAAEKILAHILKRSVTIL